MSSLDVRTRPYTGRDRRPVTEMLARAFADDPVVRWFVPVKAGRPDRLRRFFRVSLTRDVLRHGEVHVAERDGTIVGAAFWRRPGEWQGQRLMDLPWWLWVFGSDLARAGSGLDAIKAAHPTAPHWYLPTIGVDPAAQGLGVGSALLTVMLTRCDAEGSAAYLESSKQANVPFYSRHGFRVIGVRHVPDGPPFWPMWRDPAPAS